MAQLNTIKSTIESLRQKARTHFSLSALDQLEQLSDLSSQYPGDLAEELTPEDLFFVFLGEGEWSRQQSEGVWARSWATGLKQLPGNWWGTPGLNETALSQKLVQLPEIEGPLLELTGDFSPKEYAGSETATLAREFQWTVADLAGGLLAHKYGLPYNWRAPLEKRKSQISHIHQTVSAQ